MTQILRQSTQVVVRVGPFVDVGDGFTPETGVTLSGADEAELLKAAGAATVDISGATWAAITGADGWYNLTLTTSHTDTIGTLDVVVNDDSVCLPVFARFQVIEEAAFDAIYASSASPATAAGVSAVETDTQDIQSRLPAALFNSRMDCTIDGTGMEAAAAAVVVDAWEAQSQADPTGFHVNVIEIGGTAQTANDNGADINAILVDTTEIGVAGAGLTEAGGTGDHLTALATQTSVNDLPTNVFTSAMTESYAANGAAPTPAQALMAIHQMLMQFAISGTSLTVKQLDNSTTAFVVTLDDATTPTSAVRT